MRTFFAQTVKEAVLFLFYCDDGFPLVAYCHGDLTVLRTASSKSVILQSYNQSLNGLPNPNADFIYTAWASAVLD